MAFSGQSPVVVDKLHLIQVSLHNYCVIRSILAYIIIVINTMKGDIQMFVCPYMSRSNLFYRTPELISYVRILHASPNAPAVDVYVNNTPTFRNIVYRNFSQYIPLQGGGQYNIKVFPTGTQVTPIINQNLLVPEGKIYTIAAIGEPSNISLLPVEDLPLKPISPGKASVRFVHLSPDAPNVDITLPNGNKLFSNIGYKGITEYIPVASGTYTIQARLSGTNNVVLTVPNITVRPNNFYTVYAIGYASKTPGLQVLIPLDGNSYLQLYTPS